MDTVQSFGPITSWRQMLIEGESESITLMLADLEKNRLKRKGFDRDTAEEQKMNWRPDAINKVFCFVAGPQVSPRLILCLNRVSKRRVRGGTYSIIDFPTDFDPVEVAAVINDVISDAIIPAATSFGLKVTWPRLGPNSQVEPKTMAALIHFCNIATGGGLPLSEAADAVWRKFIIMASRENVAFDEDELTDWFVSNGWTSEDGRALTERFVREATLLAEYAEAGGI
ncbi:MAG: hypothetical protein WCL32_12035 [Planctomycetota bacterium]|jgi:hypothetical protein